MFQLVERLARGWQLRGRVCRLPVPSKLVYLADKHHPIEVRLLPLKVYHGAIWRLKEGWVIQLNENDPSYRKRFTLFHEAFHILAHCKTVPVFRNRRSDRGSFNEALADYFAACVLMPRVCVREKWAEVHDAERMAEIFDVSEIIMGIRLKELGLI
ncbi:MAG: ImmA/IrrE family metallo-endopeptidase [Dehalococcoidales bacterium]